MERRQFVRSTAAAGVAALSGAMSPSLSAKTLAPTPPDYEGPFYRTEGPHRTGDLVIGPPRGTVLSWEGRIVTTSGRGISEAVIEIWQADPLGRYRHPADHSAGERWKDFLYWGQTDTGSNGQFSFRTYVPGAYGGRPAHIHYKVWVPDQRSPRLTSQLYFENLGGPGSAARHRAAYTLQTGVLRKAVPNEAKIDFDVVLNG